MSKDFKVVIKKTHEDLADLMKIFAGKEKITDKRLKLLEKNYKGKFLKLSKLLTLISGIISNNMQ